MADVGTGSTITFGTSSYSASVTDIQIGGQERAVIDTSHMGTTGARTKIVGDLYEPGTVEVSIIYDPNSEPPFGAAETITVTWPIPAGGASGATLAGSGFISSRSQSIPLEDLMTATYTIQYADDLTYTDSA